ncbi:hypothetical protein CEXT_250301 [Caerostris extrusa]|uniref:Uncharacterized protein n=1 Tax=Caerostris extrusa TaxID=172846 RepID=A0AAV4RHS8_CAEEX|nr:hypothetical protein CEXT_250301 [Caerostris extrusa]
MPLFWVFSPNCDGTRQVQSNRTTWLQPSKPDLNISIPLYKDSIGLWNILTLFLLKRRGGKCKSSSVILLGVRFKLR